MACVVWQAFVHFFCLRSNPGLSQSVVKSRTSQYPFSHNWHLAVEAMPLHTTAQSDLCDLYYSWRSLVS